MQINKKKKNTASIYIFSVRNIVQIELKSAKTTIGFPIINI